MELGNFSVSLAVKDIEASQRFYEQLGFKIFMGESSQHWRHLITDLNFDCHPVGVSGDRRDHRMQVRACVPVKNRDKAHPRIYDRLP